MSLFPEYRDVRNKEFTLSELMTFSAMVGKKVSAVRKGLFFKKTIEGKLVEITETDVFIRRIGVITEGAYVIKPLFTRKQRISSKSLLLLVESNMATLWGDISVPAGEVSLKIMKKRFQANPKPLKFNYTAIASIMDETAEDYDIRSSTQFVTNVEEL